MSGAPDFTEAVLGYRAWRVGEDGTLCPWTFTALAWEPGVNTAVCSRNGSHAPPVADCMCGLYALTDPSDRRLNFLGDQVVGAIAAWGDMEVHRTGFRAQFARVVALAMPARADVDQLAALELASERYDVPLVPASMLSLEARRYGAPLPQELWMPGWRPVAPPRRSRSCPPVASTTFDGAARGIATDAHLWVETALGAVVLGVTAAFSSLLGPEPALAVAEPGAPVAAGDRLATIGSGEEALAVWAPVGGRVAAVNPRLATDPGLLARDPEGAGWLARVVPSAWEDEGSALLWGRSAKRDYAAALSRDALHGDAFADVRLARLRAMPPVGSWSGVLHALRGEREQPLFADAQEVAVQLGGRLSASLARDAALRDRLGGLGIRVAFVLADPDARLVLDCRGGACVETGEGEAELEMQCSAETAHAWFTGSLDVAGALRRGELSSRAARADVLHALTVLKHLRISPVPRTPSWARGRRCG